MNRALASGDDVELPPGFGFKPKDEVLVNYYLKLKNTGNYPHVDKFIVTIQNMNNYHPSELQRLCSKPWDDNTYWYFFGKWEPCGKGNRFNRKARTVSGTDLGSWRITSKVFYIMDSETNIISGKRSILSFNSSCTEGDDADTRYIIHAFEMIDHSNQSASYVLCRLHENPTKTKKNKFFAPSNVEIEMRYDTSPLNFEMPIPRDVNMIPWVQDNSIGEQDNGSFSQSPDSTVLDGDGVSFDDISNGNTPLPTVETQPFQEYGEEAGGHYEMQDSNGFPALEDMDYEGVDGHGNIHVFRTENGHQRSFSQLPDSTIFHGGNVPEAPTATQGFDDQAIHDLQSQPFFSPDGNDWPPLSSREEPLLQFAERQFDYPGESVWGNLDSYNFPNHQMTMESPHLPVHQRSGFSPAVHELL